MSLDSPFLDMDNFPRALIFGAGSVKAQIEPDSTLGAETSTIGRQKLLFAAFNRDDF